MSEIFTSVSIEKEWANLSAGTEFALICPLDRKGEFNSLDLSAFADVGISENGHLLLDASFSHETERDDSSVEASTYYSTRLLWREIFGRRNQFSFGTSFNYSTNREYDYGDGETDENNYSTIGIGPQINHRIQNLKLYASILFYYQVEEEDWEYLQARFRSRLNIDLDDFELSNGPDIKLELEYRYNYYFNDDNERHRINGSFELRWDVFDWLQFNIGCGVYLDITLENVELSPYLGITLVPTDNFAATLKFFPMESYYSSPY